MGLSMSHFVTYLALEEAAAVDAEALADRYRSLYGEDAYAIQTASDAGPEAAGDAFVVMMDKVPVSVMFVDAPMPTDAYQEALTLDLIWPEARDVMQHHQAHAIVGLVGDPQDHLGNLNGAAAVTLVAGALATLLPTAALVSIEGRVVMKPDMFGPLAVGLAKHEVPVSFWTTVALVNGERGADGAEMVGAMSYGLQPFIGRELEFVPASLPAVGLAERLTGLCQHLIMNGPVIKDNDTVGLTPDEQIASRYRAEGARAGVPIIELSISDAAPPEHGLDHAEAVSMQAYDSPRMAAPEPMPVQDYEAPAKRQAAVFGKRGGMVKAAAAATPTVAQTKSPARWPGLRLFARK